MSKDKQAQTGAEEHPQVKRLDTGCNACGKRLNSWDARCSKALSYKHAVCESCMAEEYDMQPEELRAYFEEVFGMRPCLGL